MRFSWAQGRTLQRTVGTTDTCCLRWHVGYQILAYACNWVERDGSRILRTLLNCFASDCYARVLRRATTLNRDARPRFRLLFLSCNDLTRCKGSARICVVAQKHSISRHRAQGFGCLLPSWLGGFPCDGALVGMIRVVPRHGSYAMQPKFPYHESLHSDKQAICHRQLSKTYAIRNYL